MGKGRSISSSSLECCIHPSFTPSQSLLENATQGNLCIPAPGSPWERVWHCIYILRSKPTSHILRTETRVYCFYVQCLIHEAVASKLYTTGAYLPAVQSHASVLHRSASQFLFAFPSASGKSVQSIFFFIQNKSWEKRDQFQARTLWFSFNQESCSLTGMSYYPNQKPIPNQLPPCNSRVVAVILCRGDDALCSCVTW